MCAKETESEKKNSTAFDNVHVRRLIKQRFYQWAIDQADGNAKRINWPRVSEVVAHHTGVTIAPETLRKNFRPASNKQNKPPNQFRGRDVWEALYAFLSSDAVSYLSPNELTTSGVPFRAFGGLQEFFDPSGKDVFPDILAGRFSNIWLDRDDGSAAMTVDFFGSNTPGPAHVELREYADDEFLDEESEGGLSFSGGVVHQAGKCILAILREVYSGQIKTLALMQTNPALNRELPVEDIAVLNLDGLSSKPLERIETPDRDAALADPSKNITYKFDGSANIIFLTRC